MPRINWRRLTIGLALVAALLVWGYKGWRIYSHAQATFDDMRGIEALLEGPRSAQVLRDLGPLLLKSRADVGALRAEVAPLLPLTAYLGWVPTYGRDLLAAKPLLDTGVQLTIAADDSFAVFSPLVLEPRTDQHFVRALRNQLIAARPRLDSARAALHSASNTWALVQFDTLSPSLRERLRRIDTMLPLARDGIDLVASSPDFLDDLDQLSTFSQSRPDLTAFIAQAPVSNETKSLGALLSKFRGDLATMRSSVTPLLPRIRDTGLVRSYDAEIAAAEPLLDVASNLSVAADELYSGLASVLQKRDASEEINGTLIERLAAAKPQLEATNQALGRVSEALAQLQPEQLSQPVREQIERVTALLPTIRDAVDLGIVLPSMLGANGRRDYLLLAQNSDELRATGGFISGAGILTLDRGKMQSFSLDDSVNIDNIAEQIYPDPPDPMLRYMNIEMWLFRDANWSPDFPTSANMATELYKLGQGREVSDVIAFDPAAVQGLLETIGPVSVEGLPYPISAENVLMELRVPDNLPGNEGREEFKRRLGHAIVETVRAYPDRLDLFALGRVLRRALDERHILIYTHEPAAAAFLAKHGWDGAVRPGSSDFLMVVDTNVGYNKVNPNIAQTVKYSVDLSDPKAPQADLTVQHTHRLQRSGVCQQWGEAVTSYNDWLDRCYWNYLRVLIPSGSDLLSSTTQPTPAEWLLSGESDQGLVSVGQDGETAVLSTLVVVPLGGQRETDFRYQLPATVLSQDAQGWHYRLKIQKQAGTETTDCVVHIRLPVSATLVSASEPHADESEDLLRFEMQLNQDRTIDIVFRDS
jgi:hypothetical protein